MNEGWGDKTWSPRFLFAQCPSPSTSPQPPPPWPCDGARLLGGKRSLALLGSAQAGRASPGVERSCWLAHGRAAGGPCRAPRAGALLPAQHQCLLALRAAKQAGGYFCLQTLSHFV